MKSQILRKTYFSIFFLFSFIFFFKFLSFSFKPKHSLKTILTVELFEQKNLQGELIGKPLTMDRMVPPVPTNRSGPAQLLES